MRVPTLFVTSWARLRVPLQPSPLSVSFFASSVGRRSAASSSRERDLRLCVSERARSLVRDLTRVGAPMPRCERSLRRGVLWSCRMRTCSRRRRGEISIYLSVYLTSDRQTDRQTDR